MQMPDDNQPYQDEALEAPPQLVVALSRLPKEPVFIPPTADEAILRASREHLEKPSEPRVRWFRLMPWLATAAAAILLLAAIPQFFRKPAPEPGRIAAFARGDINHDGRLDILDAFALASRLKQGGPMNLQLDVNADGVVNERDLTALAARAVKLEQGDHS